MAEYVYAKALAWDERTRYGLDELKRMEAEHLRLEGRPLSGRSRGNRWSYLLGILPENPVVSTLRNQPVSGTAEFTRVTACCPWQALASHQVLVEFAREHDEGLRRVVDIQIAADRD